MFDNQIVARIGKAGNGAVKAREEPRPRGFPIWVSRRFPRPAVTQVVN